MNYDFSQDFCLFLFPNLIFEFLFLTLHYVHSLWTFNLSFPIFVRRFFSFIFLWIQSNSIFFYFPHENWLWINTAYFGGFMYLLLVCKVYFKDFLENNFELKESEESFSLCQSLWWFISEQIFSRVSIICCSQKNRSQCC